MIHGKDEMIRGVPLRLKWENTRALQAALEEVVSRERSSLSALSCASESTAGAELLRQFIIDILGRCTPEARLFSSSQL